MKEAAYYENLSDERVRCYLCPHHCLIKKDASGICLTRKDVDGKLYSLNYFRHIGISLDPIEKKPLYHFYPGTQILSTGPNGCTFKCGFCQNYNISQFVVPTYELRTDRIIEEIREAKAIGIAYTYSEPFIWYETIMEIGLSIKNRGFKNVMVTNGFMEEKPLADLLTLIDAFNVDIKSMDPSFYNRICKGRLDPVLRSCIQVKKAGAHLEITNLLITGENDSDEAIYKVVNFIKTNLGRDTPIHFSRYFPMYKMTAEPTPLQALTNAYTIAKSELDYVYIGNVQTMAKYDTVCPKCQTVLVKRGLYNVEISKDLLVKEGKVQECGNCGEKIELVMTSGTP